MVILGWIGATMNNLFLCYLLSLTLVNYPGLCNYGVVEKVKTLLGTHLGGVIGSLSGGGSKKEE